jgi:hypothetical protein
VVGEREHNGVTYDLLEVTIAEAAREIGALAAAAPAVLVLEPADLRERVRAHLGESARG